MSARLDDRGGSPQALPGRDAGRPAREPVHIQLSSEQCDRARPAVGLVRRCTAANTEIDIHIPIRAFRTRTRSAVRLCKIGVGEAGAEGWFG